MLTADARWTRLSLLLLALGAAPAFAGALQQAIVAAPARNNGVPLPGVAPPLANAAPGAPIGRVLNAQHDIANEVRARQGLVAAAQARGQRQGAFLSCPAGLRPCRLSSGAPEDDDDDEAVAELFECINPLTATRQCGGCISARDESGAITRGEGVDCLAAPGVKSASCSSGQCLPTACKRGFARTAMGCVAAQARLIDDE